MSKVAAGGPSTINGVLYQMLWALSRVGTLQATNAEVNGETGELNSVTLILEPPDGGDQQEIGGNRRVIEQLKARSGERSWSLADIIRKVFPNLYRARDSSQPDTVYRFVTEGRRGRWKQIEDFFASLRNRSPGDDLLGSLDNSKELKFLRNQRTGRVAAEDFWQPGPYTERRLFEQIVQVLREPDESIDTARRHVWSLLANFKFVPGMTFRGVQEAVDAWLLAIIDSADDLDRTRSHLLIDLARRATEGGARIVAASFLNDHGLDATPLTNWLKVSGDSARYLGRALQHRGFDPRVEARPDFAAAVAARWTLERPILVLTGESGQGKTWLAHALLSQSSANEEVGILVEATGDHARDLAAASAVLWQQIIGHQSAPPFVQIRARFRKLGPIHARRPICVLVDGIADVTEARQLAFEDWEDWDVRLAMTCSPSIASSVEEVARQRCEVIQVPDFSTEELHSYLHDAVGETWPLIRADVRSTLRRPLLARLYHELVGSTIWHPTTEYELYKRFWNRLYEGEQAHFPMDAENLKRAAFSLLEGVQYPWAPDQLCRAVPDSSCIQRLIRVGWLRQPQPGRFEVWHVRLLNWAVAEALVSELRERRLDVSRVCDIVRQLYYGPHVPGTPFLPYVPMDLLWLVADPASGMPDIAPVVLAGLEMDG